MGHSNPTAGYPMVFNMEADPREPRNTIVDNRRVIDLLDGTRRCLQGHQRDSFCW
jgi:hypothetical protein